MKDLTGTGLVICGAIAFFVAIIWGMVALIKHSDKLTQEYDRRQQKIMEQCLSKTSDFNWCWENVKH